VLELNYDLRFNISGHFYNCIKSTDKSIITLITLCLQPERFRSDAEMP
jgi:hypothetical protein